MLCYQCRILKLLELMDGVGPVSQKTPNTVGAEN